MGCVCVRAKQQPVCCGGWCVLHVHSQPASALNNQSVWLHNTALAATRLCTGGHRATEDLITLLMKLTGALPCLPHSGHRPNHDLVTLLIELLLPLP